jgi:hypothetical protein
MMRVGNGGRHSRRTILQAFAVGAGLLAVNRTLAGAPIPDPAQGAPDDPDPSSLQPGQFFWHPDRAPDGPVAIIVSIARQLVFVYRNGILIGVSTCSTGKPGHSTPSGVFTILQKAKTHTSSKYDEAMPDMQRLTWQGIALHVGDLPGYPDSHGCVHLPTGFADPLFDITAIGTPVILAGDNTGPEAIRDPGPILGQSAKEVIAEKVGKRALAVGADKAVAIVVSRADKTIYVLEDGNIVAQGAAIIKDPSQPLGSNVFVWRGGDASGDPGSSWDGLAFAAGSGAAGAPDTALIQRIDGAPEVMEAIRKLIRPGTVLLTTDLPATPDTRSDKDFTVMVSAAKS